MTFDLFFIEMTILYPKNENSGPVSRVLYRTRSAASVINLDPVSQLGSSNLPLGIGRDTLQPELLPVNRYT